uniref:Cytochrome P450 720B n=1 Tax=Pinus elliottii TaxID=42064 RepID=A0A9E8AAE6_PINEL|nr:cytochrome P450 720B [Pinus elliottii]
MGSGIMTETLTDSWLVGLLCLVLGFLLLQLYKLVWGASSRAYKLPPGSTGWPLIGETISFFRGINSTAQPRQFIQERERRYGEIFRSNLFGRSRIVVSVDPEFNKHVLQHEGRQFQANYPKPLRNLIGKYGLLSVHGDLQRKLHGAAVNLLRFERLSVDFMEDIQNLLHITLAKWEAKRDIHLQEECHQLVLNLMAKQLLDLSPSKDTEEICEAFGHFSEALLAVPIKIPGTKYARGFKAREFLIKKIYESIEDRRQHPEAVHNDLLTKLLKEDSFSEEIIADFILFLLFAGHETSSRSMSFAIKFLTDCPRALRVGNFGPGVFRETKEDIKTKGGFVIPRGWTVYVFLTGTHLDEKYHSSALKFDPWRWQPHLQDQELLKNPSFMPFGGGARLCPGMHLAKMELALFLHNFVTKFRWEALQDDKISYFPFPRLIKGLPIRLRLRE